MALKSNREGLRKESVDYLGNLIIGEKLKDDIFNSIDSFIKLDLLWTNSATTSTFAPQTISLDLSSYKFVYIITYRRNNNFGYKGTILIRIGDSGQIISYINGLAYREISGVSKNGVNFDAGIFEGTTNNDYCIPIYIYGVK